MLGGEHPHTPLHLPCLCLCPPLWSQLLIPGVRMGRSQPRTPSVHSRCPQCCLGLLSLSRADGTTPTATACSFPDRYSIVPYRPSAGLGLVLPPPCSLILRLLPSTLGTMARPLVTDHICPLPKFLPVLSQHPCGFLRISSQHLPLWVRHTLLPAKALIYSCSAAP